VKELKEAFIKLDTTNSGFLTLEELAKALKTAGFDLAKNEILEVLINADAKQNGRIDYSEFLAATLQSKVQLNKE